MSFKHKAALTGVSVLAIAGVFTGYNKLVVEPQTAKALHELVQAKPACVGSVITIDDFNDVVPCNLTPPQRLDIRYHIDGPLTPAVLSEARGWCDDNGGSDLTGPADTVGQVYVLTCEGIDY